MVWLSMHIYFNEGSFDHQHQQFIIFHSVSQKQSCQCFPVSYKCIHTVHSLCSDDYFMTTMEMDLILI